MIFLIDFINSCVSNLNVLLYFNLLSKRKENLSSAWMAAIYIVVTLINTMLLNQFKSSIVITISCIVFLFIFAYCYQFKWYTRILFVFLLLIILICSELFTSLIASLLLLCAYFNDTKCCSILFNGVVVAKQHCFSIAFSTLTISKKPKSYSHSEEKSAIFPFASILVSYSFL